MKVAITGIPSSGKSTILDDLSEYYGNKYQFVHEYAREFLTDNGAIDNWHKQNLIGLEQSDRELKAGNKFITETPLYMNEIYGSMYQCDWFKKVNHMAIKHTYDLVLMLEPLPFVKDGIRYQETQEELDDLSRLINLYSKQFTDTVIKVPMMPRERRRDFAILSIDGL